MYMWKRHDDNVFARLQGHGATVNTVSWCPTDTNIFASGSDDSTVIIWGVGSGDSSEQDEW